MTKDFIILKCPKCGYEYLASEIFYPDDILGKPNNIIRDDKGHIILVEGEQPHSSELFECYNCGTTFKADLGFNTETKYNKDLEEDDFVIDLQNPDKTDLF